MIPEEQLNQWDQIVTKAWQDDAFKKRLLANPSAALNDEGLKVAAGIQVRVVENTDTVLHLTLPSRPRQGELSEAELAGVAGGSVNFRLLNDLTKVFGWNADQVGQILDAGRGKARSGSSGGDGGSHPGDAGGE